MKRLGRLIQASLLALGIISLSNCTKKDFDEPELIIPYVNFNSNTTIAELKALYSGGLDSISDTLIIQGIVTANDQSGNFYKTIEVQDATGAIEVKLNRTNLYTELKIGQRVFIKCNGMYLGNYGGMIQLGYIYNGGIGQLPDIFIDAHLFRDSLPGPAPAPEVLTIPQFSSNSLSKLIKIENVHFTEAGEPVALNYNIQSYTNRNVEDDDGNAFVLRTSGYANFAAYPLPKGKGSINGILSIYNGEYQLYIRDTADISDWDTAAGVNTNLYTQNFDSDPADWVKYSVASNHDWAWSSTYTCMTVNGYGADVASDDWLISPALNLAGVQSPILNFRTWTKYTDTGITNPMEVMISVDYSGSGDPENATWVPLTCTLSASNSGAWASSGDLDLSAYQGTLYIGFHYVSSGTASNSASSWEVDSFVLKGIAK